MEDCVPVFGNEIGVKRIVSLSVIVLAIHALVSCGDTPH